MYIFLQKTQRKRNSHTVLAQWEGQDPAVSVFGSPCRGPYNQELSLIPRAPTLSSVAFCRLSSSGENREPLLLSCRITLSIATSLIVVHQQGRMEVLKEANLGLAINEESRYHEKPAGTGGIREEQRVRTP